MSAPEPLAAEDQALLEKLATRVVELRMETPAILTLETVRPMAFLSSQAMIFFEPFAQMLFRAPDYQRFTRLVSRQEALEFLTTAIEARADARDRPAEPKESRR
jgi:hypothetical protein